ncbi:MAG: hypothetical protein KAW39_02660 [Thermoplasmata archaeon]|nr:hypothetical protein [Thermoplasmata archaeon]
MRIPASPHLSAKHLTRAENHVGGITIVGNKDNKGRLLLSESEASVRYRRLVLGAAAVTITVGPGVLLILMRVWGFDVVLATFLLSLLVILLVLLMAAFAMRIEPVKLFETGVENFQGGLSTFGFKRFDEIESAEIRILKGFVYNWTAIIFRARCPRFLTSARLVLEEEDRRKDKLREIVEFLNSKGLRVDFGDSARDWHLRSI